MVKESGDLQAKLFAFALFGPEYSHFLPWEFIYANLGNFLTSKPGLVVKFARLTLTRIRAIKNVGNN